MRRRLAVLAVVALLAAAGAGGCQWLIPWAVADRHPKETVKAEYNLEAERLVIVPYAGIEILFNDRMAPLEVSKDIVNQIGLHLKSHVKTIVHPIAVDQWQESTLEWPNMALPDIAKAFQADTLLYVELERYTMVEERSASLFRGRVRARVQVVKADAPRNPVYETTVETVFPEDQPVGVIGTSERVIRAHTNLAFAEAVVRKFYQYQVEIKGGRQ
jgi:hypothetical protein